ncbi:protein TESPA1 [Lepisosteus oculatus]|uniref:protein TESPA1 n=1 Tax=Lepisosteus oculatus TaxID=7918 RepID=UPI00073FBD14|nr:PREDICTED: protein TESPA1 [Lepisosteus oculatus]XP_015199683.1 PREDICTED: protein TESPA1 [Lepisosteus oculatus]XP_015199684.1 PREDICTED: protein TESPA1 [Lepisosteus oculatus]
METPSPSDKRRAWLRSSRAWQAPETTLTPGPQADEVFLEGNNDGKVASWLQCLGYEMPPEDANHLTLDSFPKAGNSFEDDLILGAEAIALHRGEDDPVVGGCPLLLPPPRPRNRDCSAPQRAARGVSTEKLSPFQFLNLGHSMASSGFSTATTKSASSVSQVLQMCAEDAEETLYNLGFGQDEPQITAKIPPRFFSFPSQLGGINFRLFLESQLRRIKEEDPDLSLASRFRQVEVLTAMANAFYSLYSYVSKTPVQKLAPPEFSFASPIEKISMRFSSVRSEPRSPVDRLKDTVSKMCLYTGSRDLASPGPSPRASPRKRSSLPNVVEFVLGHKAAETSRHLAQACSGEDPARLPGAPLPTPASSGDGATQGHPAPGELALPVPAAPEGTSGSETQDVRDKPNQGGTEPNTSGQPQAAKFTQDVIHPRIVESVHKKPFMKQTCFRHPEIPSSLDPRREGSPRGMQDPPENGETGVIAEGVVAWGLMGESGSVVSCLAENASDGTCRHPSHSNPGVKGQEPTCQITVTGWDGESPSDTDASQSQHPWGVGQRGYLSPSRSPSFRRALQSPQQGNSFEIEEVHSAGEDESSQSETRSIMTSSPLSAVKRQRDMILREDSLQSDSSGFVEDDFQAQASPVEKEKET